MLKTIFTIGLTSLIFSNSQAHAIDSRIIADPMIISTKSATVNKTESLPSVGEAEQTNTTSIEVSLVFNGLLEFGEPISRSIQLIKGIAPTTEKTGILKFSHGSHTLAYCENPPSVSMGTAGVDGASINMKLQVGKYNLYSNELFVGSIDVQQSSVKVTPVNRNAILEEYSRILQNELFYSRFNVQKLLGLKVTGKTYSGASCEIQIDNSIDVKARWHEAALAIKVRVSYPEETFTTKEKDREITTKVFAKNMTVSMTEKYEYGARPKKHEPKTCEPKNIQKISFVAENSDTASISIEEDIADIKAGQGNSICLAQVDLNTI